MSKNEKNLVVVSYAFATVSILSLIAYSVGAYIIGTQGVDFGPTITGALGGLIAGVLVILAVVDILIAHFGIMAAKDTSKIDTFFKLCIVAIIIDICSVFIALATNSAGSGHLGIVLFAIFPLLAAVFAGKIKKGEKI